MNIRAFFCALLLAFVCISCGVSGASSQTFSSPIAHTLQASVSLPVAPLPFHVNSIAMSVTPATLSTWNCGAYIQVVYHAVFYLSPGASGGVMEFSWTVNNGRGQTNEKLTILPGQMKTDYTFTWQGALLADHVYPGEGLVMTTSPNVLLSKAVVPSGKCR